MSKFTERRTPSVTKRQTVMDYAYRTGEGGDEDMAVFELPNDDIPTARSAVLYLAHADFEALGSPEVITVTINPGDLLNVEVCRLCTEPELLLPGESIPLCDDHWSGWVTRFVATGEEPPCAAHLIVATEEQA